MSWMFFDDHQAEVIREASARLVPGPDDDVTERGHPGAREANVVGYIDRHLGGLDCNPPTLYAITWPPGGPQRFLQLTGAQQHGWSKRLAELGRVYRDGVRRLDAAHHRGGFLGASVSRRDAILSRPELLDFRSTLFAHTVEGMYSHPAYGGNDGAICWQDIAYAVPTSLSAVADPAAVTPPDPAMVAMLESALPLAIQLLLDRDHADG
ncbi:gluconate 2-dehydrogenase subunit 3 family protein [Kribbella sp. CA-293567]|uniref:gluconate 2-dehydrogenase subunit 3 family protein n=1 Tax=Kribbella sp. CA-293567 TaxID=3002436 RepID=UPI0022DDC408|nr:gluconate 2-dehydrogenase subunit 3 family protein [Kribbella sp. CA-293567]WBQ07611.1 gluconate 2-dehydrogenase subunit 3 family protein [Kribbella sp. CA-293567]